MHKRFLIVALLAFAFVGCGGKSSDYRDLSRWSPIAFEMRLGGVDMDIKVRRVDVSEYSGLPGFHVIEGVGTFQEPDEGRWILVELRIFLPQRTYKEGDRIEISAVNRQFTKEPTPYLYYAEYTMDEDTGASRFSLSQTVVTPTTSPTTREGTVSGTVVITNVAGSGAFEGTFHFELKSPDGRETRSLRNGAFTYEAYQEK